MRLKIVFLRPWRLLYILVMATMLVPCLGFSQGPGQKELLWAAYGQRSDSLSCLFFENKAGK